MAEDVKKIIIQNQSSQNAVESNVDLDNVTSAGGLDTNAQMKVTAFYYGQALKLVSSAANEVEKEVFYEIGKGLSLDDNYIAQRDLAVAQTLISKTSSIFTSTLSGAVAGLASGAGPIGAAVGAAIGLTTSVVSSALETYRAMDQQQINLNQMDAQLSFTRQRAGWSTTAASIGEDL